MTTQHDREGTTVAHTGKHCQSCGEWSVNDRTDCPACDTVYGAG